MHSDSIHCHLIENTINICSGHLPDEVNTKSSVTTLSTTTMMPWTISVSNNIQSFPVVSLSADVWKESIHQEDFLAIWTWYVATGMSLYPSTMVCISLLAQFNEQSMTVTFSYYHLWHFYIYSGMVVSAHHNRTRNTGWSSSQSRKRDPFTKYFESMSTSIQDRCLYLPVYDVMNCVHRHPNMVRNAAHHLWYAFMVSNK